MLIVSYTLGKARLGVGFLFRLRYFPPLPGLRGCFGGYKGCLARCKRCFGQGIARGPLFSVGLGNMENANRGPFGGFLSELTLLTSAEV